MLVEIRASQVREHDLFAIRPFIYRIFIKRELSEGVLHLILPQLVAMKSAARNSGCKMLWREQSNRSVFVNNLEDEQE